MDFFILTMRMSSHRYAKWALQSKRQVRHSRELPMVRFTQWVSSSFCVCRAGLNKSVKSWEGGDKLQAGMKLLTFELLLSKLEFVIFVFWLLFCALVLSICLLSSLFKAFGPGGLNKALRTAVPSSLGRSLPAEKKFFEASFRGTVNDRMTHGVS